MRKYYNKLYKLGKIIDLINKDIPKLNSYNINRLFVRDKNLLNMLNKNINLDNKIIAKKLSNYIIN
nr:hypothetical protein [uncultured Mediterranean phage uvMED]BAR37153.1 hypothetical protein [uncultured Mediterranean phage uvMED]|tara:strand:+ start:292 stop:489 length:198 start_codon:yes stop_codon:yes gene_type:complete